MIVKAAVLLALLAITGCVSPDAAYVEADRLTYESVGKEYSNYVEADPRLTEGSKAIRRDKMVSWKDRIDVAKKENNR